MKSLEIINERIEQVGKRGKVHLFSFETTIDDKDLQEIKQDLEVLEIIKIKNVNLYSIKGFLNMHKKYSMSLEDVLKAYNLNYPKLTLEELLKLKQWLEENEK